MKQLNLDYRDASVGSKSKRGDKHVLPFKRRSHAIGDQEKYGKIPRHREKKKDFALHSFLSTSTLITALLDDLADAEINLEPRLARQKFQSQQ